MWPWTAETPGYVYLLHFARPLGNLTNPRAQARHYVGFSDDLEGRLVEQLAGRGAKIVAAALKAGITFEVFSWPAPLAVEKLIKATKKAARYCPTCSAAAGRPPRPLPIPSTQLALPFDDFPDFPIPPVLKADWLEISMQRNWRRAPAPAADNWDEGLL
jgi:hypothetical protein